MKPAAEAFIDESVVRALLVEQATDLADLPLVAAGEGWDIAVFRLGDDLAVRLPHRAAVNPYRGVPLRVRDDTVRACLRTIERAVDHAAISRAWQRAVSTAPWSGPPLWIHGDLHPGNLLVDDGRLSAVIDFIDLTAGDPATDLSVAWMLFPPSTRARFRATASGDADPIDDATWMRARGWALAFGLLFMTVASDNAALAAVGRATVNAVLDRDN